MGEGVYQLLFHILSFGYISQQHQELTKLSVLLLPPTSTPPRGPGPRPPWPRAPPPVAPPPVAQGPAPT